MKSVWPNTQAGHGVLSLTRPSSPDGAQIAGAVDKNKDKYVIGRMPIDKAVVFDEKFADRLVLTFRHHSAAFGKIAKGTGGGPCLSDKG